MWLRRKLPGEALPIVPKAAGEKVKGAGGLTSPRQQQVSIEILNPQPVACVCAAHTFVCVHTHDVCTHSVCTHMCLYLHIMCVHTVCVHMCVSHAWVQVCTTHACHTHTSPSQVHTQAHMHTHTRTDVRQGSHTSLQQYQLCSHSSYTSTRCANPV